MFERFMKDKERRLVAVPISSDYLIDMLREGFTSKSQYQCIAGVPRDAVMVSDYFDFVSQRAMIIFYHPSFEIVDEGAMLPVLAVRYKIMEDQTGAYMSLSKRWKISCFINGFGKLPAQFDSRADQIEKMSFLQEHFGLIGMDVFLARQNAQQRALSFGWLSRINNFLINLMDWQA